MELTRLDLKNKKILFELDTNARKTTSQIAKRVRLSRETVTYRINNLIKNKVIGGFIAILNLARLNYTNYKVYFKLQNVDENREKEIINYVINHQNIIWVASCSGRWDLIISIWAKNIVQFNNVLSEIVINFPNNLSNYDVTTVIGVHQFRRKYLFPSNKSELEMPFFGDAPEESPLDKNDIKILSILAKNARQTNLEISRKLNISDNAVKYKTKKLIRDRIIQGFRTMVNTQLIGYSFYKILLSIHNLTKEKEKQLLMFCKYHPNIIYLVKCVGKWGIEIDMEVGDIKQFRQVMMEIRNRFSDVIRSYESLLIYEEHKLNYYPF